MTMSITQSIGKFVGGIAIAVVLVAISAVIVAIPFGILLLVAGKWGFQIAVLFGLSVLIVEDEL